MACLSDGLVFFLGSSSLRYQGWGVACEACYPASPWPIGVPFGCLVMGFSTGQFWVSNQISWSLYASGGVAASEKLCPTDTLPRTQGPAPLRAVLWR